MTAEAPETRRPEPEELITDWYLPEIDAIKGFVYPGPVLIEEHPRLFEMAQKMLLMAKEKTANGYEEFVVRINDRTFRGHKIMTITGPIYALRRLPAYIPSLDKLGMDAAVRQLLLHKSLCRGGLVLVCGETGQGKSTTCAATVKERMTNLGSFCLTVEDPPEMPLHGAHGKGRCLQTEVQSGKWAEAMRGAMRCYPTVSGSMLYVGETRDPETAAEVLRIATNGHLVLTTVHADGLDSAIRRYMSLAGAAMVESEVRNIMASSFRLAIHQQLVDEQGANGVSKKRLKVGFLFSPNNRSPVAQKMRTGENLNNEIRMQEMALKTKGAAGIMEMWDHG